MINSSLRLFALLITTFALLVTMWVSAAQADTLASPSAASAHQCRKVGQGVVMCEGAGWQLPEPPRGTVKRRPATSHAHRAAVLYNRLRSAHTGSDVGATGRVGTTVVIARLGTRI
jgi:hypothetical protein